MTSYRKEPAVHTPGQDATVFETTDPARTEALMATAFGVRVKISDYRDNYHYRLVRMGSGSFHINTTDHTAVTEQPAQAANSDLIVVRIHRGVRTNVDLDERLGPGDVALHAQPGQFLHTRVASIRQTTVHLPMLTVAQAARNRPDDDLPVLRFHSLRPAHPAAASRWVQTVTYITDSVRSNPDGMAGPLLSEASARLLAAALLTTFPNSWTIETHHQDRTDANPTTLTRAIAFIEANADLDISVADVARAAYVTVRAVQLAFRRHLDTSPMAYLRRVRLDRAREQLRDATPGDGTTISGVAARWGFADPSRFTALYRATYGQAPSQTLHD